MTRLVTWSEGIGRFAMVIANVIREFEAESLANLFAVIGGAILLPD